MDIKALVLTGYGINCEREMAEACSLAGAVPAIAHSHHLLTNKINLNDFHLFMLPGGFSFGDELGAGKAFANRLAYFQIKEQLQHFVNEGKCILGVCNGFQLLVKLGLLPGYGHQDVSLAHNDSHRFDNRWVPHAICSSPCIFTKGMTEALLPIRHAEGKLVVQNLDTLHRLQNHNQIVFRYLGKNPNGSTDAIAGLCDSTGRILGMMAHPEAAVKFFQYPQWTRIKEQCKRNKSVLPKSGEGLKLFQNAVNYIKDKL